MVDLLVADQLDMVVGTRRHEEKQAYRGGHVLGNKLYTGLPIAQLSFMALDAPAERPYGSAELGSHYQGQTAATESRYGQPVR